MKIVFLFILLFSFNAFADQFYALKKVDGCYVKSYINKKFYDIDYKKFWGMKLLAKPHKKNADYMIFKMDDQLYVTKMKCLDKVEYDQELDELLDSKPDEDFSHLNKPHKYQIENLQFDEHKWMIELDAGTTMFASQNPVFTQYSDLSGIEDESGNVYTFSTNPRNSKYKGGSLVAFTVGYRISDMSFLSLKIKSYSGKKTDYVQATRTGPDAGSGEVPFEFKDTFRSLLIGNKFMFFPNSHFKPSIGIFAGLSTIESKAFFDNLKFESVGLAGELNLGVEYFFTNHVSLGVNYGIEVLGTRTFRLKEKEDAVSDKGFKTRMNYTNTFATAGLKFYF